MLARDWGQRMTEWLGVALLPTMLDTEVAVKAQAKLREFAKVDLQPRLSYEGNLPHVTLWQGPLMRTTRASTLLSELHATTGIGSTIVLLAAGVRHQPRGWIFLMLERPLRLIEVQDAVLRHLVPNIDVAAIDTSRDMSTYSQSQRESYNRYGYRYVGSDFMPHLTLGRTDEATAERVSSVYGELPESMQHWRFDRLSLYRMGEDGAHAETLAVRQLEPMKLSPCAGARPPDNRN